MVKRFFAWINRNRRLAKDFEATIESVEAFLYAASAVLLLRRLARLRIRSEMDSEITAEIANELEAAVARLRAVAARLQ